MHGYGTKKSPGYDERIDNLRCCGRKYWAARDEKLNRPKKSGHRRRVNTKLEDMRQHYNAVSEFCRTSLWRLRLVEAPDKYKIFEEEAY